MSLDPKKIWSFHRPVRIQSLGIQQSPSLVEKITDDPKTAQSTVTCLYQANIAGYWRNVSVLWCKNLINHSLTITVDGLKGDSQHTCKIDLKPWHFWSRKGFKSFEVEGNLVEVFWDLRSAKFSGGPEPGTDYYVALVSEEEVVLLLGDLKKKAYKRTKSRPALVDAVMYYKKENVFGKKCFSTRAKFEERQKKEHDIVVESLTSAGTRDPEMWISIDGIVLIHIRNLQWKFRGNQNVLVNKQTVQVFWDVHDWLFNNPAAGGTGTATGTGQGLFIFKPAGNGTTCDTNTAAETDKECGTSTSSTSSRQDQDGGSESSGSGYYSTQSHTAPPEFCLLLCAWKME